MRVNDEFQGFSHEKKGMSPLIATMLLIAFAVALGAMIMNWGANFWEKADHDCSGIIMELSPYLCYADNIIKISVKNTGKPVEAVTIKMIDETGETTKVLPESRLESGGLLRKDVPFVKTGKTSVGLIASIKYKEQVFQCDKPAYQITDLPNCNG